MRDSKEKILQTFFLSLSSYFSFWCPDFFYLKNELIEEQQCGDASMQFMQEKATVHFSLQSHCQPINVSFRVWFAKFVLQLISSRTRPHLLWLLQEFAWIAVGGDIFHWEDFRGIYGYTIHKSFHQGPTKVVRGLMFVACSTLKLWGRGCVSPTSARSSIVGFFHFNEISQIMTACACFFNFSLSFLFSYLLQKWIY